MMSYYDELMKDWKIKYNYKDAMKRFLYEGDPNSLDTWYEAYLERLKSRIENMDLTPYLKSDLLPESIKEYMYNTEKEKNMLRNDPLDTLTTINYNYNNDKTIKETLEYSHRVTAEREQKAKEALEEFQNKNTYILKWFLMNFVEDYKFDWMNKTVIVWWKDGVKTHVHCMYGDEFDPEVGFMKCLFKRALGSGNAVKKYFKEKIPEQNAVIVVEDDWPEDTEKEIEAEDAVIVEDLEPKADDVNIEDYVSEELEKRLAKVDF